MKKMMFSAIALIAFSATSIASEKEKNKETKKELKKETVLRCSSTQNGNPISVNCACDYNECQAKLQKLRNAIKELQ